MSLPSSVCRGFIGMVISFGLMTPRVYAAPIADEKTASVIIYAAGDIADCRKKPAEKTGAAKTAKLIQTQLQHYPQAWVVTLGDNTYPIGAPKEFSDCYEPTWGVFKQRTLPSPGNHDYGVPFAHGYFQYFGDLAGPDQRGYYSRVLGSWLILSLNSQLRGEAMEKQKQWLTQELKTQGPTCTLAFWHHPVFATGGHGDNAVMRDVWAILVREKADIVLAGHDHNYERLAPLDEFGFVDQSRGLRSFVVGTGGAYLTPMWWPRASSEARQNEHLGVLRLDLMAGEYRWEFLSVDSEKFSDKGRASCH